jgi:hypothetical protein
MTTGTMLEITQIKYGIYKQFSLMHRSTSDTTLKKIPSLYTEKNVNAQYANVVLYPAS